MYKFLRNIVIKSEILIRLYLILKNIILNIKFLTTNNLYEERNSYDIDILRNKFKYEFTNTQTPNIKNIDETLDFLLQNDKCSLCRFGDGEFEIIVGKDSPFQKSTVKLGEKLKQVLQNNNPNICVCLPKLLYEGKNNTLPGQQKFWINAAKRLNLYNLILEICDFKKIFYSTEVSIPFVYKNFDGESYFKKIRALWENKKITIISGKGILDGLKYNIFDNAVSIEYQYAPKKNAFSDYENILKRAITINKERIIIVILGQTATVLAYDLALKGYRALDLGHIAKTYNWYKEKLNFKSTFFNPD